ncbi:MAG: RagB/SusD family nutrient uptake outer membrane protein [Gemmatimonadota bacterium]|nr:RagB/SusD family nutrient uptake outer membrane protein [Gemmatimonadota bacterium]
MMNLKRIGVVLGSMGLLLGAACNPTLDVANPNAPDVARANASPADVENLAISSVHSWYIGATDYEPWLMLQVTADASTANYGNFGMRFNNLEPRIPYANSSAGGDRGVTESPWNSSYGALGAANDAIRAFNTGLTFAGGQAESDKFKRLAQFTQAATMTQLALLFDRAFIVDETTDPAVPPTLSDYKTVSASAVTRWAALAASEAGKSDSYDPNVFPMTIGPLTSSVIARIASTMAALTMAYTPRTAAEAATVDWAKVATYAAAGIGTGTAGAPIDISVIGDFNVWYSGLTELGDGVSWTRVDLRLINRMDPSSPAKFNGTIPPEGTSADARFGTDYKYLGTVLGDPSRGIYMQSPYYHNRYYAYSSDGDDELGPAPWMLAAESDLVRAEALIRSSGSLATAATLINNSRVTRGNLSPATAADGAAKLLGYIDYERDVELLSTNGYTLFQRRHVDGLQKGTILQLPIPAKELETLSLPIYTFGGVGGTSAAAFVGAVAPKALYAGTTVANLETTSGKVLQLHLPNKKRTARGSKM